MEELPLETLVMIADNLDDDADCAAFVSASSWLRAGLAELCFAHRLKRVFPRTLWRHPVEDGAFYSRFVELRNGSWREGAFPIRDWDLSDELLHDRGDLMCEKEYELEMARRRAMFLYAMQQWKRELHPDEAMILIEQELCKGLVSHRDIEAQTNAALNEMVEAIGLTGSESARQAIESILNYVFDVVKVEAADAAAYYRVSSRCLHVVCQGGGVAAIPIVLNTLVAALLRRSQSSFVLECLNTPSHLISRVVGTDLCLDAYEREMGPWSRFRDRYGWSDENLLVASNRDVIYRAISNHIHAMARAQGISSSLYMALMQLKEDASDKMALLLQIWKHARLEDYERAWLHDEAQACGGPGLPPVEEPQIRRRTEQRPGPRLRIGNFVVFGQHAQRGVVCEWLSESEGYYVGILPEGEFGGCCWERADQCNLVEGQGVPIRNATAGKYFSKFIDGRYVFNKETRRLYPDDEE